MSELKLFPMLDGPAIPWSLAEIVYEAYCQNGGRGQSLERVAERGGFGWGEVSYMFKELKRKNQRLHKTLLDRAQVSA